MKVALLFLFTLAGFVSSQEVPEYEVLEDAVHHVTSKADFEAQLEATDKLVVVDFFATWCGPCKAIAPKIEKLAQELKGEVVFLKVDIDEVHELAVEYQIHAIPNFVFIKNKKELERVVGANLEGVKEAIKRHKDAVTEGLDEITPLSGAKDDADKVKSELIKMLQDSLHKTVEKIKTRIDDHHQKANDLIEKAHELARRLKAHHADLGEKVRNSMKKLSGQAREHLRGILDSFKQGEKRSVRNYVIRSRRSTTNEVSDAVKSFFRDMKISFKEKYGNFAEWLKESYKTGVNKAMDKNERMKDVARQVKEKAKTMKESAIKEAIEVLEPYKKELGSLLWTEMIEEAKKAIKAKHQ